MIPFLNRDGNAEASEQRADSTEKYGEEHSTA